MQTKAATSRPRLWLLTGVVAIIGVALGTLMLLAAPQRGEGDDLRADAPRATPPHAISPELIAFAEQCKRSTKYRSGQVDYPARLTVRVGQAVSYEAAVDVRDAPLPAPSVIPREGATSETVVVQCVVGARLIPVGGGIGVDGTDADTDGGWRYQRFTPSGVLEWSWSVTALSPRPQQLRLELRPAMQGVGTSAITEVSSAVFLTTVEVRSTWIQRLGDWFETEWPRLATVAVLLGAALTAVLIFVKETRQRVTDLAPTPPTTRRRRTRKR